MKNYIKILVTLLVLSIIASFVTVAAVGDTTVFTVGNGGQFDARIDDNGEITVPVTVNQFPVDEKIAAIQVEVLFDTDVLELVSLDAVMKISYNGTTLIGAPTWIYNVPASNARGKMTASFLDTSAGSMSFNAASIEETNVLFNLTFKVLDDTADTIISVDNVLLSEYSTGNEVKHTVASGNIAVEDCVVAPYVASTDTSLSDLKVNGETVEGFGPENEYYEMEVTNEVTEATIDVVTNHANATFEILSDTALAVGENTIEILVTAEDEETEYYYTIVITRLPSTDATLTGITLNDVAVEGFAADVYDYVVEVANDVTEVTVDAAANHENAAVTVAGGTDLVVGENTIEILVTAEDGTTECYYTIVITRLPSTDATLSDLTVDGETIADFAADVYDYTYEVENDVTEVVVNAIANHENATAVVEGGTDLVVGENAVTVTVTAEDGTTELVYAITVVRAPSTDATLSDLTVDGETIADFAADVYDYTYEVENEIAIVDINATVNHENATFEISGDENILPGKNLFTITVTAEDETTTETYTVLVIRKLIYTEIENATNYGSSELKITKVEGADGLRTMNVAGADVVLTENDEKPVFFVISTTPVTDYDVDFTEETPVVSIIGNNNDDEELNIFDATAILEKIAVGTESMTYAQQFIADADTNGIINIFDATTILKIVAGGKPPVFN